jgi:hypothetical protein
MSRFKTDKDVTAYPAVTFHSKPPVRFALGYHSTPLIPHIVVSLEAPIYAPACANITLRDAKRLRDWLTTYINDREGVLR